MTKRLLPLLLVSVAVFIVVACAEGEGATATPSAPAAPAATATPIPAPTPAVVSAPIEDITIQKWAAKPPNSTMIVTSGLPNGCASFNDYTISRDGDVFTLQVTNLDTGGPGIGCTEIYGYVTTNIALDDLGGVVACEDYTVIANGDALTVRADPLGGISDSEPDCDDSSVSTSASDPVQPAWLGALTHRLAHEPVTNPPSSVTQYQYAGETVYFVRQVCCDITSVVYDADGVVIGQPDGGITGQGDGRLPAFFQERTDGKLIWEDDRTNEPGLAQAPAPIESVQILVLESFPPQYSAVVVSGLRNSCVSFGGYRLGRQGETFHVDLLNLEPTDQSRACNELYRTVETFIGLGSDLESGVEYTVDVNGTTETFTAQ